MSCGKGSGVMVTMVHIHEWIFIHLPNINIPYMSSKDHVENKLCTIWIYRIQITDNNFTFLYFENVNLRLRRINNS